MMAIGRQGMHFCEGLVLYLTVVTVGSIQIQGGDLCPGREFSSRNSLSEKDIRVIDGRVGKAGPPGPPGPPGIISHSDINSIVEEKLQEIELNIAKKLDKCEGITNKARMDLDAKEFALKMEKDFTDDNSAGGFCHVIYEDVCYRIIGRGGGKYAFTHKEAEDDCKSMGGSLAPILSKIHYELVYNFASRSHTGTSLIWLGLYYMDGQLELADGTKAPYALWHDGFPIKGDRPKIGMRVESGPHKHMFNDPAFFVNPNALCQYPLRRDYDGPSACSFCNSCNADYVLDPTNTNGISYSLQVKGDFCPIIYKGVCYRIIGGPHAVQAFTHGEAAANCRSLGGRLAPIVSKDHYNLVYDFAAKMHSGTLLIWLGMYYKNGRVELEDDSANRYVQWHTGFPKTGDRPKMGMRIETGPLKHMFNDPSTYKQQYALCSFHLRKDLNKVSKCSILDDECKRCSKILSHPFLRVSTTLTTEPDPYSLYIKGDFCPLIYNHVCYRIIGRPQARLTFSHFGAEAECRSIGGRLAPIMSSEHYNMVYDLAREMYAGTMWIWIGMHYKDGKLLLLDGTRAPYVWWHDGFPLGGDRPAVGMRVEDGPAKHIFNDPTTFTHRNALCQFAIKINQ